MKRFWVFSGHDYYPGPGMDDLASRHDDEVEAIEAAKTAIKDEDPWHDWSQVVNVETATVRYFRSRPAEHDGPRWSEPREVNIYGEEE